MWYQLTMDLKIDDSVLIGETSSVEGLVYLQYEARWLMDLTLKVSLLVVLRDDVEITEKKLSLAVIMNRRYFVGLEPMGAQTLSHRMGRVRG